MCERAEVLRRTPADVPRSFSPLLWGKNMGKKPEIKQISVPQVEWCVASHQFKRIF